MSNAGTPRQRAASRELCFAVHYGSDHSDDDEIAYTTNSPLNDLTLTERRTLKKSLSVSTVERSTAGTPSSSPRDSEVGGGGSSGNDGSEGGGATTPAGDLGEVARELVGGELDGARPQLCQRRRVRKVEAGDGDAHGHVGQARRGPCRHVPMQPGLRGPRRLADPCPSEVASSGPDHLVTGHSGRTGLTKG